jgi:hypothetical protein
MNLLNTYKEQNLGDDKVVHGKEERDIGGFHVSRWNVCVCLGKGDEEFNFGHSGFEVLIVHSRGNISKHLGF